MERGGSPSSPDVEARRQLREFCFSFFSPKWLRLNHREANKIEKNSMSMALQPELGREGLGCPTWSLPHRGACVLWLRRERSPPAPGSPPGPPPPPCVCAGVTGGHRKGLLSTLLSTVFVASQPRESSRPDPSHPSEPSPGCGSRPWTPVSRRGPRPPHSLLSCVALLSPEPAQVPDTPLGTEAWLTSQGTEATSLQHPCSGCVCHVPA